MPELDIAFVLNLIRSYMQSLLTGMLQRLDSRANKGVPYNPTLFILYHFFMLKGQRYSIWMIAQYSYVLLESQNG